MRRPASSRHRTTRNGRKIEHGEEHRSRIGHRWFSTVTSPSERMAQFLRRAELFDLAARASISARCWRLSSSSVARPGGPTRAPLCFGCETRGSRAYHSARRTRCDVRIDRRIEERLRTFPPQRCSLEHAARAHWSPLGGALVVIVSHIRCANQVLWQRLLSSVC
jgi:hypothetical protein